MYYPGFKLNSKTNSSSFDLSFKTSLSEVMNGPKLAM